MPNHSCVYCNAEFNLLEKFDRHLKVCPVALQSIPPQVDAWEKLMATRDKSLPRYKSKHAPSVVKEGTSLVPSVAGRVQDMYEVAQITDPEESDPEPLENVLDDPEEFDE